MWARNCAFTSLCLIGLAALAGGLFSEIRLEGPANFDPHHDGQSTFRKVVDEVNQQFRQAWSSLRIQGAPLADDLTIARRMSLGLTGTLPSLEEIRAIETQPSQQRIQWYLAHLLEDRRSSDYLAERLARTFVGTDEGPFLIFRRRRFVTWLSDRLFENMPYDHLVRRLIADTGLWTSSPSVNFVTAAFEAGGSERIDPAKLAGRISRAFLGVRLDCVQCHDDMLGGEWSQRDFHQLAAFFSETDIGLTGLRDRPRQY